LVRGIALARRCRIIHCMRATKLTKLASAVGLVLPVLFAALAIGAEDIYDAPAMEPAKPWFPIIYTIVFLVALMVVAFKNARRTHLD